MVEEVDEIFHGFGQFGLYVFVLFHFGEVSVYVGKNGEEFGFVSLLVFVELDDAFLKDVEEVLCETVVCFFLLSGCETRIY